MPRSHRCLYQDMSGHTEGLHRIEDFGVGVTERGGGGAPVTTATRLGEETMEQH